MKPVALSIPFMLLLTLGSFATGPSALSAEESSRKFVRVPVLYMTDRAAHKKSFGAQRKLEIGTDIYSLNFGTLNYSVSNTLEKKLSEKHEGLSWSAANKKQQLKVSPLAGSGSEKAYHDFGKVVTDAAAKAGTKEVFVFTHGYNMTFNESAELAAKLAYNVERPVVIFDWPSKGKLFQYGVDAGNNEWSQEHFNRLLEELKAIKEKSGLKLNLIAHSMGNRLAIRSAPVLKGQHLFERMFLVDPDFDAETFMHYLIRYAQNNNVSENSTADSAITEPTKVQILFSRKDRALPFAQLVFGGYTRLGQAADIMLSTVFDPLSIPDTFTDTLTDTLALPKNITTAAVAVVTPKSSASKTASKTTSKTTSEATSKTASDTASESSAETKQTASACAPKWSMNFEWIDFTELDHGLIGHTIPFQLIANLSLNNTPGEGLELVETPNCEPNKLSRIFSGLFNEKKRISSNIGSCKRVTKIKLADSKLATSTSAK